MIAEAIAAARKRYTVKAFLVPLLTHPKIAKIIKYSVYFALSFNFIVYVIDDIEVFTATLTPDTPWDEVMSTFSTTIDTAAWLGLVFLFELETYRLSDESFEGWIPTIVRAMRVVCYVAIGYAAYGYTIETLDNYNVTRLPEITSACQVADQGIWLQMTTIDYEPITSENCGSLSSSAEFYRVAEDTSIIDRETLDHVQWVGWIDVINAFAWIFVVWLIEIEVWLQAQDRFSSRAIPVVQTLGTIGYLVLIADAVIWGFTGYDLYTWDAFLWIFGFWAIELNLAEWERDRTAQLRAGVA